MDHCLCSIWKKETSPEERVKLGKITSLIYLAPPIIDHKPIVKVFDTLSIETERLHGYRTGHCSKSTKI